jgi:hypothetical protein
MKAIRVFSRFRHWFGAQSGTTDAICCPIRFLKRIAGTFKRDSGRNGKPLPLFKPDLDGVVKA